MTMYVSYLGMYTLCRSGAFVFFTYLHRWQFSVEIGKSEELGCNLTVLMKKGGKRERDTKGIKEREMGMMVKKEMLAVGF